MGRRPGGAAAGGAEGRSCFSFPLSPFLDTDLNEAGVHRADPAHVASGWESDALWVWGKEGKCSGLGDGSGDDVNGRRLSSNSSLWPVQEPVIAPP